MENKEKNNVCILYSATVTAQITGQSTSLNYESKILHFYFFSTCTVKIEFRSTNAPF